MLWEVKEAGQCKVEGEVEAEVVVRAWGILVDNQQGGSTEAAEASRSPLGVARNLVEGEETDQVKLFPI